MRQRKKQRSFAQELFLEIGNSTYRFNSNNYKLRKILIPACTGELQRTALSIITQITAIKTRRWPLNQPQSDDLINQKPIDKHNFIGQL